MGFKSARAFFTFLSKKGTLDFNYSYYVRIEGSKVVPSGSVILTISSILGDVHAELLILTYCGTLFPRFRHLFRQTRTSHYSPSQKPRPAQEINTDLSAKQKFLTELQVATIGKSQVYYNFFVLLTLAREPIPMADLQASYPNETLQPILNDFLRVKLIGMEKENVFSIAQDVRFPVPDSDTLRALQKRFDRWNAEFDQSEQFTTLVKRTFLRRVSPRYIHLILGHCNLLFDLMRSSEELNTAYNEEVLMLHLKLSKGSLPG